MKVFSMKKQLLTALSASVGLAIGNFGWQLISMQLNWGQADRTFFQCVAVATVIALTAFFQRRQ